MKDSPIVLTPGYDYDLFFRSSDGLQGAVDALERAVRPGSVTVEVFSDDLGPDSWSLTFEGKDSYLAILNRLEPSLEIDADTLEGANVSLGFAGKLNRSQCEALIELYERVRSFIPTRGFDYGAGREFGSEQANGAR